jgi:hypothetical protein
MKTSFNKFIKESDENPLYSHDLRMKKGYRPKYRSGLIAVRFLDDDISSTKKFKDEENGEFKFDYQKMFSYKKGNQSDFIKYFEEKYDVKQSDYREGTDDYFVYFECKPGEEKQKMEEIAKDKIVKVVDYVDIRSLEGRDVLEDVTIDIAELVDIYGEESTEKINQKIKNVIDKLQSLL